MNGKSHNGIEKLIYEFDHPSDEFSPIPFWFWNDTLTEREISRQIHAFFEKGVNGFVIHPRLGLDPEIGYMGEKWLYFVKYAVDLAEKLGMRVILYDEAMYPSGSACGMVVAENPDHRANGLRMSTTPDLSPDERIEGTAVYNGTTLYFILTPTLGTIRGVYYGQDDGEPNAPAAADLLDPSSVQSFIRLTHEKYYSALSDHFGKTVIAIFTDEPSLLGRCAVKGIIPWTHGLIDDFLALGYTSDDLVALFDDTHPNANAVRDDYSEMIYDRMNRVYYGQIAAWCTAHNVALAGHPAESDDIGLLSNFGIPCQDIVWRYIAPAEPNNITGAHSTMGKCASDSARHRGKRRNGNECFGVCGHRDDPYAFDREDMKWYIDWLFARGCNLIIPHAFYYSLRDKRRDERPPEVGMHSPFWSDYKILSDYIKRCSSINTDSVNITDVAILCTARHLPDLPARALYENQIEFNYLERDLLDSVTVENGVLRIANQAYRILITEDVIDKETHPVLREFCEKGGTLLCFSDLSDDLDGYVAKVRAASKTVTDLSHHPDLRLTRVEKYGVGILFLSNEGEGGITTTVRTPVLGIWDAESGIRSEHDGTPLTLTLPPRKSLHLILKQPV